MKPRALNTVRSNFLGPINPDTGPDHRMKQRGAEKLRRLQGNSVLYQSKVEMPKPHTPIPLNP